MSAAAINTAPTPAAAGAAGQAGSATGVGAAHGAQTSGLPAIFENMLATLTAAENGATPVANSGQVKGANLTVGVGKVSENDDKAKAKGDDADTAATTTAVATATTPPDAALALIVPAVATAAVQAAAATSANGDDADDETANTLSAKTFGLAAGPAVTQVPGATDAADADKAKAAAALSADGAATNANATAKADAIATTVPAAPVQPQAAPTPTPAPVDPNTLASQLPAPDAAAAAAASAKTTAATPATNAKAAAPKLAGAEAPKPSAGSSDLAVTAPDANTAGKIADALAPIAGGASKAGAEDKASQAVTAEAEADEPATTPTPTPTDPATAATTTPATLAAAAAAPIVRGSPQTVANLSAEIVKKLDARSTQFDVQLDPAGLGKVDVRVQIGADGKMSAAMSFDTPQAAAELRSRSNELQQALAQSGFDVTGGMSFDVSTDRGQNGQAQNQQPEGGAAFRGKAFQAALDTTADTPLATSLTSRRTSASGVDIRI